MRAVLFLSLYVWSCVVGQDINAMKNMPKYDSRYDYLDVDAILDSKRLVKNYVECLVSSQRCTPEGKQLKRILPEALRTKCVRCTDKQKKTAVKVIHRLKTEYPDEWAKLAAKWDPTGDFTRYFEDYLAKDVSNTIPGNEIPGSSSLPPPVPTDQEATPPKPVILNRFGDDDDETMSGSPSGSAVTPRPATQPPTKATTPTTTKVIYSRPTLLTWTGVPSEAFPTRFPLRPFPSASTTYSTAINFIDQLGYKIMRTTELVTDILRNTVRAVVGR